MEDITPQFKQDTELVKVDSSNIYMVGYDKPNKVMTVIFHNNGDVTGAYQYYNVPQNVYTSVKNGRLARICDGVKPSVGGTFNKLVKRHPDKYKYKQVDLKAALRSAGKKL